MEQFCEQNNRAFLPASPDTIVVYMSVCSSAGSLGSLLMSRAEIHYFHKKKYPSFSFPTEHAKVAQVMVALRKSLGKPVVKRAPISKNIMVKLLRNFLPEGVHTPEIFKNFI